MERPSKERLQDLGEEQEVDDASARFAEPLNGLAWHPSGRPYTRRDYRKAGLEPPPRSVIAGMKREGAIQ